MNDRFTFVGKFRSLKDGNISVQDYKSGWQNTNFSCIMVCGDNSQFLRLTAGKWSDPAKDTLIYTYKKSEQGQKCEPIQVHWNDRFDESIVDSIASFKRYTIDLDIDSEHLAEGATRQMRHYIHAYDFINALNKIVSNEAFKDCLFKVSGNVEYSYSTNKGQFYSNFTPTYVKRVADDAEVSCTGEMTLVFTDDNSDANRGAYTAFEASEKEGETSFLNAYSKYYDSSSKKNGYFPYRISVPATNPKITELLGKLLSCDNSTDVKEYGIKVNFINGAQPTEDVDETTLTAEQKMSLEVGLITMDDIKKERQRSYGDRITAVMFVGPIRGYTSGPRLLKDVSSSELTIPPIADAKITSATSENSFNTTDKKESTSSGPSLEDLLGGTDIFDLT